MSVRPLQSPISIYRPAILEKTEVQTLVQILLGKETSTLQQLEPKQISFQRPSVFALFPLECFVPKAAQLRIKSASPRSLGSLSGGSEEVNRITSAAVHRSFSVCRSPWSIDTSIYSARPGEIIYTILDGNRVLQNRSTKRGDDNYCTHLCFRDFKTRAKHSRSGSCLHGVLILDCVR